MASVISHQSVYRIRCKIADVIPLPTPLLGGRPHKLTARDSRLLVRYATSGQANTAVELKHKLTHGIGKAVSVQTVRRALRKAGLHSAHKVKRPLLKRQHKKQRLEFARKYEQWTEKDWSRVIFSDETKINRLGSDGQKWIWKRPGTMINENNVSPTLKFGGGSLLMWGCINTCGVGHACRIDGNMNASLYTEILRGELIQSIQYFGKENGDVIFQHDNDPKHTSNLATNCLKLQCIQVLDWPAQSPDLNPIENLWDHLKRRLANYETPADSIYQLWQRTEAEWEKIPSSICVNLVNYATTYSSCDKIKRRIHKILK